MNVLTTDQIAASGRQKDGGKSGWRRVRFDEMAENIGDRVDNPAEAGVERYVGLEHLDPESLKIRRWGTPDEVEATKLRFQPGDIVFGKRRAYQRKLAVADFEGICSAHAMVLRAREEVVVKEFLPVFMQSEVFFERALSISVGSLSPTINWKTLAAQEFVIPPKNEQRRIADILWAAEDVREGILDVQSEFQTLHDALLVSFMRSGHGGAIQKRKDSIFGAIPVQWQVRPLNEVADVAYGISESVASNNDPSIGWPILTGANISLEGTLDLYKLNYIARPTKASFILRKGDLLLNWRSGSPEHVGKTAIFDLEGDYTYASFVLRVRPGPELSNVFLHRLLNYMRKRGLFCGATSQQVNFKMNATMLREVSVLVPPVQQQNQFVQTLKVHSGVMIAKESHLRSTIALKAACAKEWFGQEITNG
jgi:type I restriction enzyme S subunit